MNQYEMVAIIVLVTVAGSILKHAFTSRSKRPSDQSRQADNDMLSQQNAQEQRIQNLEKRIEILERIITSDGYDLKQRFRELYEEKKESK